MLKIKQFVSSKTCLGCEGCCRFAQADTIWSPALLDSETEELVSKNIPPSVVSSSKKIHLEPKEKEEGFVCALFEQQANKCKIYPLRPLECRLYPFLINRREEKIFLAVDLHCPFAAQNIKGKKFNEYAAYLNKFLNNPSVSAILKNNPQIIQEYPEAVDIEELAI